MSTNNVIVRLQMLGAQAFNSASQSAASNVKRIGDSADDSGKGVGKLSGLMGKMSGPLAAVGAASGAVAAGIGAAGVAAAGLGLKFNASMEQSEVAFTNLLGSSGEAKKMLDTLYDVAAKTPFEFPQLTQATQRLLGFGMAADEVVPTMTAVGDAVAAAGGGAEQIDRVSTALGQMQAKGKVSSEELLQLAESGVPALKILGEQLGLTGEQLSDKLQKGAISADKGIGALVAGMQKRYGGMAEAQSKTFSGMISSLKDQGMQVLGKVTMPLFEYLRDSVLPAVQKVADAIGKWANAGGITKVMSSLKAGFSGGSGSIKVFSVVGKAVGDVFRWMKVTVGELLTALRPMQPFLDNVLIPLLKGFGTAVVVGVVGSMKVLGFLFRSVIIPALGVVAKALGWVGEKAKPLKPVFYAIGYVLGTVLGPTLIKGISLLGKFGGVFKVVAAGAKVAYSAINAVTKIFGVFGGLIAKLGPTIARNVAAIWPKVKATFGKLLDGFKSLGSKIVSAISDGIKAAPRSILNALFAVIPGGGVAKAAMKKVLGLATGGTITRPGVAMVGERGPELVHLSQGARVIPLTAPTVNAIGATGGTITIPVYLDGRVITTVVADRTADRMARR